VLGYADYRSPVAVLYLCGSGGTQGAAVTGAPGHNAAREISGTSGAAERDRGKR